MQRFPPETLGEIFYHCLPLDVLDRPQPDVTTAPMLLCQVCSHWRAVALTTPWLWESLYHAFRVSSALVPSTMLLGGGIHKRDLEFLKWWKSNMGGLAPKLRLEIRWFFVSFISSARYLDMDRGLACISREYFRHHFSLSKLSKGYIVLPGRCTIFRCSSLRRLFLDSAMIAERDLTSIGWSNLTHMILMNTVISHLAWLNSIRQCVNLEFGVFHIGGYDEHKDLPEPPVTELPKLRQLVVKWNPLDFGEPVFLFKNLYFPILTALRLESVLSVGALHEILDSTPSLQELHLSYRIPRDPDECSRAGWFPGPESSTTIDPLSRRVPHLRRLVLQVNLTWNNEYRDFDYLIDVIMRSPWLGLGRKGSAIEELALTADYSGSRHLLLNYFKTPILRNGVRITALENSPWWMDGDLSGQYVEDPFGYSRF
ncbi:hypothetical protein CPB84DRAFT_1784928 [Gymnopilus junonius]|uniref:F-box domain-containing protein n=1 Tax=Gymnopilus junonius TaxID=109634 RepID=A0A9P5NGQ9_GYMJU|nr:hypothetical protein CPB84DRAFT_1784928 [Gymnopilus junonius]